MSQPRPSTSGSILTFFLDRPLGDHARTLTATEHIHKLPNEMKLHVASYLSTKDFLSLHKSSRTMRDILHNQFLDLHRIVHVTLTRPSLTRLKRLAIHPLRTEVKEIAIVVTKYDMRAVRNLDSTHPTLAQFTSSGMDVANLAVALSGFQNCAKVDMIYGNPSSPPISHAPMFLARSTCGSASATPAALRGASATILAAMTAAVSGTSDSHMSHLVCQILDYSSAKDDAAWEKAIMVGQPALHSLQKLDIELITNGQENPLRRIFNVAPNLRSLFLKFREGVSPVHGSSMRLGDPFNASSTLPSIPAAFPPIFWYHNGLESLTISNTPSGPKIQIDSNILSDFLQRRERSLRKLHLTGVTFEKPTGFLLLLDCIDKYLHLNDIKFCELGLADNMKPVWQFQSQPDSPRESLVHLRGKEWEEIYAPCTLVAWSKAREQAGREQNWPLGFQLALTSSLEASKPPSRLSVIQEFRFGKVGPSKSRFLMSAPDSGLYWP
ncbi:hypothetical protein BLS_006055 [Venturia inaequalis]|uniref:F-box domain-containing protein n=1 Tax=Venturia inaequalis TaxID=5025 RepID=A0A8H3VRN6_VENIN|nr:hypothetical protein BLS_006055 [Venturia inaequalis]KAE9991624.1 hypothetical protein EG327_011320 [Venturia inaequalis]RDI87177.1 hypothetical protein Vi05172_g2807 [Venturia inaequalis]